MKTIDVETLRTWLEEGRPVTVLDIRPMHERVEWSIPGSMHIDAYDALKANDPNALADVAFPGDIPVVTVCAAGKTSLVAAEQLQARGIQALSLEGGMKAWSLAWNIAEVPVAGGIVQRVSGAAHRKRLSLVPYWRWEEAVVIDAALDPQVYLDLASQNGWQISASLTRTFTPTISPVRASWRRMQRRDALSARAAAGLLSFHRHSRWRHACDGHHAAYCSPHARPYVESTCYLLEQARSLDRGYSLSNGIGRPDLEADEQQATTTRFRALPQPAQDSCSHCLGHARACRDIPAHQCHLMASPSHRPSPRSTNRWR